MSGQAEGGAHLMEQLGSLHIGGESRVAQS